MEATVSRSIRVGLFAIFGATLLWIVHETFTESNLYSEYGYPINAPFEDLKQLKNGSDVRLAGVSIGAVTATKLQNGQAMAVLSIEPNFNIPIDSTAVITTAGLLGNNYISIQLGTEVVYLKHGDTIKTKEAPDINKVIEGVGELGEKVAKFVDSMNGKGSSGMMGPFNSMIQEVKPKLNAVLDNMIEVSNRLAKNEGTLGKLISEDKVYHQLIAATDDISKAAKDASGLFDDAKKFVEKLDVGDGPLNFVLNDKEAAEQLKKSVANVFEFSNKLNDPTSSLGKIISDDELYNRADAILGKVEGAVENVENSGPISAIGVVSSALF